MWFLKGVLTPISWRCVLEFTNLRPVSPTIESYEIEYKREDGKWEAADMIVAGHTKNGRFFSGVDLKAAKEEKVPTFDSAIEDKLIAPNQTIRGWVFFRSPTGFDLRLRVFYMDGSCAESPIGPNNSESRRRPHALIPPLCPDTTITDVIEDLSRMKINLDKATSYMGIEVRAAGDLEAVAANARTRASADSSISFFRARILTAVLGACPAPTPRSGNYFATSENTPSGRSPVLHYVNSSIFIRFVNVSDAPFEIDSYSLEAQMRDGQWQRRPIVPVEYGSLYLVSENFRNVPKI